MQIRQHSLERLGAVAQVAQKPEFVIALNQIELSVGGRFAHGCENLVMHELDAPNRVPLARVYAVFAELRQVEDIAIEHNNVRLYALYGINDNRQEKTVAFDIVQVRQEQDYLVANLARADILAGVFLPLDIELAVVVNRRMLGDLLFQMVLLAGKHQTSLPLEFKERAKVTIPRRF